MAHYSHYSSKLKSASRVLACLKALITLLVGFWVQDQPLKTYDLKEVSLAEAKRLAQEWDVELPPKLRGEKHYVAGGHLVTCPLASTSMKCCVAGYNTLTTFRVKKAQDRAPKATAGRWFSLCNNDAAHTSVLAYPSGLF